ncbi:MAG: hypothetical protein AAFO69_04295 [Bacteroidota bacterium]
MYGVKVAAGMICGILLLLLLVVNLIENPSETLYEETVTELMVHEGLHSKSEVETQFPRIKAVNHKIARIATLNSKIHQLTGGQAPNLTNEKRILVSLLCKEMRSLQKSVHAELLQILSRYTQQ